MRVNIILLAAGKGERFLQSCPNKTGRDSIKQLAQLSGSPLINHVIGQLNPLLEQMQVKTLFVTLGANKNAIQTMLPSGVSVIASSKWTQGMGHSLAESVLSIHAQSSHVLIALADQALVCSEHYQAMLEQCIHNPTKIIATHCSEKLMAPAIFPQQFFTELTHLQGDKGAGKLLQKYAAHVHAIPNTEAKSDIDTFEDLAKANQILEQQLLNKTLSHCQNLEPV